MAEDSAHRVQPIGSRPDIAKSWRRAEMYGLNLERPPDIPVGEINKRSRLMSAAVPVLNQLYDQVIGEPICLILADRHCRVVRHWSSDQKLRISLEKRGVGIGMTLDEGTAGTNGLGTAFETGHGVTINGAEHYLEALKDFSCYGHPIRHPLTRRIEGVLDVTVGGAATNPLFRPLLARAVQDIEANILDGARESERRLFHAFQHAARKRSAPVAVLGEELILANRSCLEALNSVGPSVLRILLDDVAQRGHLTRTLDLGAAGRVRVDAERIEGTRDGALFYLRGGERPASEANAATPALKATRGAVLIAGEPGTGRTTIAYQQAGSESVLTLECADALTGLESSWAARLMDLTLRHRGVVVVEDVHILPESLCAVVRRAMDLSTCARVVLTACPVSELAAAPARLVGHCEHWIELAPLQARVHELPALLARMGAERRPDRALELTPRALEALSAHPWRGNLSELARLVDELCARPWSGRIDAVDLPARYRGSVKAFRLGGREQAERNAIIGALTSVNGNKLRAAEQLGISRTTLYRRMRLLGVDDSVLLAAATALDGQEGASQCPIV
jgi:transcriptional regulator of acetoin/glycerol metabolism